MATYRGSRVLARDDKKKKGRDDMTVRANAKESRTYARGFARQEKSDLWGRIFLLGHLPLAFSILSSLISNFYITTAFILRTPAEEASSFRILKGPTSAVCSTWGPPQISLEK